MYHLLMNWSESAQIAHIIGGGVDIENFRNNRNFRAFGKTTKSKGYFKFSPRNFALFESLFSYPLTPLLRPPPFCLFSTYIHTYIPYVYACMHTYIWPHHFYFLFGFPTKSGVSLQFCTYASCACVYASIHTRTCLHTPLCACVCVSSVSLCVSTIP